MLLRWLHVSDFHTGRDTYGQTSLAAELVRHVESRVSEGREPHLVFITGDVGNRGAAAEFTLFTDDVVEPLRRLLADRLAGRLFVVPGNHDVARDLAQATVAYTHPEAFPEYFDPTEQGFDLRKPSLLRFQAYHQWLETLGLQEQSFNGVPSFYTVETVIDGTSVGILGLNTAWLSQDPTGRGTSYAGGVWTEERHLTPGFAPLRDGLIALEDSDVLLVLGHHPLHWISDLDHDRVKKRLRQARSLYLHGHLHRTRTYSDEAAGFGVRVLQAGAAFQARADELWRNRILWCELDTSTCELAAEPLLWSQTNQSWVLDTEAFDEELRIGGCYVLPVTWLKPCRKDGSPTWSLPAGWVDITPEVVRGAGGLSSADRLAFFDGSNPTWRHAADSHIPRREVAIDISQSLLATSPLDGPPRVWLLTGPGGEGKSTVLRQIVCDVVLTTPGWRVLWPEHGTPSPIDVDEIAGLPPNLGPWLVASDDADAIAHEVAAAARQVWESGRHDIHFLLAARDTDWLARRADRIAWSSFAEFVPSSLRGLSAGDAIQIVEAWEGEGQAGLGALAAVPPDTRSEVLLEAVQREAATDEGSFLGAMLRVRIGEGLRDHVRSILVRLGERPAVREWSLQDALCLIASPHSINNRYLSVMLMAEVLGVSERVLRRRVLQPLGDEAAVSLNGRAVLVRHRAVAEEVVHLGREEFEQDDVRYHTQLALASARLRDGTFVPGYNDFVYVSRAFREVLERPDAAVEVASALVDQERGNRYYLGELAACLGSVDPPRYGLNACVAAATVSDMPGRVPPSINNAKIGLAELGLSFGGLYESTGQRVFVEGQAAVASIGLRLPVDARTRGYYEAYRDRAATEGIEEEPPASLGRLVAAVQGAWVHREGELPAGVRHPTQLRFADLAGLAGLPTA